MTPPVDGMPDPPHPPPEDGRPDTPTEQQTPPPLAEGSVFPTRYEVLRRIAHNYLRWEPLGIGLEPTDLVNELWLRWRRSSSPPSEDEPAFLAAASHTIRLLIIDHHRKQTGPQRGGGWTKISLHEGIILPRRRGAITLRDLHEALALLRERHPPAAEVAELKIFGQMSLETIADVLDTPPGKVKRLWNLAQAFLKRELRGD